METLRNILKEAYEVVKIKIVTCNVPEWQVEYVMKLVGENGLYPSRSEAIRVAVRKFLQKELKEARDLLSYEDYDKDNFVRIPNGKHEKKPFSTYKILRRLE